MVAGPAGRRGRQHRLPQRRAAGGLGAGAMKAGSGALAAILAGPLLAQPAAACPGSAEGYTRLATPEAEIAYRWEPGTLKVGQFFKMEVVACRAPGAVESVIVDAQMPAHG